MWTSCSQILSGLKTNRNLKYLDLSYNDCSKSNKSTIWGELFKTNKYIKTLVFDHCSFGDLQTRELVKNFHYNESLKHLHLSHNCIEDITIKNLAHTIEDQRKFTLTTFDISDNYKISDSALATLIT